MYPRIYGGLNGDTELYDLDIDTTASELILVGSTDETAMHAHGATTPLIVRHSITTNLGVYAKTVTGTGYNAIHSVTLSPDSMRILAAMGTTGNLELLYINKASLTVIYSY